MSENDPSNKEGEGDPFGFSEAFLDGESDKESFEITDETTKEDVEGNLAGYLEANLNNMDSDILLSVLKDKFESDLDGFKKIFLMPGLRTKLQERGPDYIRGMVEKIRSYEPKKGNDSSEVIDDAEKERRENILANREGYERTIAPIFKIRSGVNKATMDLFINEEVAFNEDSIAESLHSIYATCDRLLSETEEEFYREQAPLVIQSEEKRNEWLEYIDEVKVYGFSGIISTAEECFESLTMGGSVEDVCKMIKKYDHGDNRAGATYSVIKLIMDCSDQGEEFASYIGWSGIDWENDSVEERNKKVLDVMRKIGLENVERFDGYLH